MRCPTAIPEAWLVQKQRHHRICIKGIEHKSPEFFLEPAMLKNDIFGFTSLNKQLSCCENKTTSFPGIPRHHVGMCEIHTLARNWHNPERLTWCPRNHRHGYAEAPTRMSCAASTISSPTNYNRKACLWIARFRIQNYQVSQLPRTRRTSSAFDNLLAFRRPKPDPSFKHIATLIVQGECSNTVVIEYLLSTSFAERKVPEARLSIRDFDLQIGYQESCERREKNHPPISSSLEMPTRLLKEKKKWDSTHGTQNCHTGIRKENAAEFVLNCFLFCVWKFSSSLRLLTLANEVHLPQKCRSIFCQKDDKKERGGRGGANVLCLWEKQNLYWRLHVQHSACSSTGEIWTHFKPWCAN